MGDTRGVLRRCTERNAEHLVFIVIDHGQDACAGLVMTIDNGLGSHLRNFHFPDFGKTVAHICSLF